MNKNLTPIILIVLAIGVYFTFTKGKVQSLKAIQEVNAQYAQAIDDSERLIKVRDEVSKAYYNLPEEDRERLDKMLPNNVDNVRLIIDVNGVAARHGFSIKDIKTSTSEVSDKITPDPVTAPIMNQNGQVGGQVGGPGVSIAPPQVPSYNTVNLSFTVSSDYQNFVSFLRELEASLRIIDISKISVDTNDSGKYTYKVEIKTYWLKQ